MLHLNSLEVLWSWYGHKSVWASATLFHLCITLILVDFAGNAAVDLESFSKHAGRSSIKTDDVMLLTRRNEGLEQILRDELKRIEQAKARDDKTA